MSTVYLTLPQWDGGSRKIRFIYLVNFRSFSLTEYPDKGSVVPLYLGADVFSNTDIRAENHPRYHAKFAKKGLATKIHFPSVFRFHDLRVPITNNGLWFYSVQGLFRIAFEMYSRQEQLSVLENFQDVWKSQINGCPLEMNYSLSEQLDHTTSSSVCNTIPKSKTSQPRHCTDGQTVVNESKSDRGHSSEDHNYCFFPKQSLQSQQSQVVLSAAREKLHELDDKLCSGIQIQAEKLQTIMLFLGNIDQIIHGNLEDKDVTDIVLALLQAKDWGSVYSNHLLNCIGRWLGQQFHAANTNISQKVEVFKHDHIEQISDLPPAEELTTELFPEAMQTLLLHWMGLSDDSMLDKRHSEYPILLLILEFANHNLITGVAHVLYSSLICK